MENNSQDKSKTQIKKEAEDLQKLGEELTRLTRPQLECMDLPEELKNAVLEARSITSNIAARRHRQFIGALMRNVDPEPVRQELIRVNSSQNLEPKSDKEIRDWLDRLLKGASGSIEDFIQAYPGADRQRMRQLLRNIKKGKKDGKVPKSLKVLRQIIADNINSN